jgi:NTP pyrophosphatase (non-canonical NTP hydrolase)
MEKNKLYMKAIEKWGSNAQLGMLQEECAELIQAVSKVMRKQDFSFLKLAEEIADVEIMMEQMIVIYPELTTLKEQYKDRKLGRLAELLLK